MKTHDKTEADDERVMEMIYRSTMSLLKAASLMSDSITLTTDRGPSVVTLIDITSAFVKSVLSEYFSQLETYGHPNPEAALEEAAEFLVKQSGLTNTQEIANFVRSCNGTTKH